MSGGIVTTWDDVALVVWGVLRACRDDNVDDLSVAAHAVTRNLLECGFIAVEDPKPDAA